MQIFMEFWHNFTHNLFKPLLLFFYLGFLLPILKVPFEFPPAMYHGLTMYLLLSIGWHGGEELAQISASSVGGILGFMLMGFLLNFLIGGIAYFILKNTTKLREIDRATVAGYYGSDSAGTFATCVGVLATANIVFDSFMPVMLAIMEIPGCLVALLLVARLRRKGMDSTGLMPGEAGYTKRVGSVVQAVREGGTGTVYALALEDLPEFLGAESGDEPTAGSRPSLITGPMLREVFLNPGLCLLMGGILIGFVSGLQGESVTAIDDPVFVTAFQGALCLFLLEMGMTASRKLKDLKAAGRGFIFFGLLAPNLFATIGIAVAHLYSQVTGFQLETGTYVLFAVLCGAASYIAVPAIQRLAIPEASPSLPLAASLGLTFSYNVTIGIPLYIEVVHLLARV